MGVNTRQYPSGSIIQIEDGQNHRTVDSGSGQILSPKTDFPPSSSDSSSNPNLAAEDSTNSVVRPILGLPTLVASPLERVKDTNFRDTFSTSYIGATESASDSDHQAKFLEICRLLGVSWGDSLGEYRITDFNVLDLAEEIRNGGEIEDQTSYYRALTQWMDNSHVLGVFPLPSSNEEAKDIVAIAAAARIRQGYGKSVGNYISKLNKTFGWLKLPRATPDLIKTIDKIGTKYGDDFVPKDPIYASDIVKFSQYRRSISCSVNVAGPQDNHQNITLVLAIGLATFARVSELINIRLNDIIVEYKQPLRNYEDEEFVDRVKSVRIKMNSPKTGARSCLYIKNGTHYRLKDLLLQQYEYSRDVQQSQYLFTKVNGTQLTRDNVDTLVLLLTTKLGRKGYFTPHSLRHGAATSASEAGISQDKIRILGRWKLREAVLRYIEVGKKQNIIKKLGF